MDCILKIVIGNFRQIGGIMKASLFLVLMMFGTVAMAEDCSSVASTDKVSCKIATYRKTLKSCYDLKQKCETMYSVAFKNLEAAFPKCLPGAAPAKSSGTAPSKDECVQLEKFVTDYVIPTNPSYLEVGRALKFINQRAGSTATRHAGL
jgi:hypothetical protein